MAAVSLRQLLAVAPAVNLAHLARLVHPVSIVVTLEQPTGTCMHVTCVTCYIRDDDFSPDNNDPSSCFHQILSTFAKMRHLRSELRGYTSTPDSLGPGGRFAASPRTPQDNFCDYLEAAKARDGDQFKPTFDDRRYIRCHIAYLHNKHDTLVESSLRGGMD